MYIVCLDMEGVLVPEIWIAFAEASGIPELKRTTRDEPDYNKLMRWRLDVLKEHGLGLPEIQKTIAQINEMENWDTEGAWSGTEGNSGYDREDRPDPGREGILRRAALLHPGHRAQRHVRGVRHAPDEKAGIPGPVLQLAQRRSGRNDHGFPYAGGKLQADHSEGPAVHRL